MGTLTEGALAVPGASLYDAARGSGPVLLILQGGGRNANGSDHAFAAALRDVLGQSAP